MLEIKVRYKNNVIILDLEGRIDVNAAALVEAVGQCLRDGYSDLLCNFEEVEFIDYMGVSVIVIAYKEVANHGGRIKFTNIPAHLSSIFSISGMDRTIDMYASEDSALAAFDQDKTIENIQKMQLRRRFKRLSLDLKAQVRPRYAKGASYLAVDILNLSAIGAFIFGCPGFKLQDEVVLKLNIAPKQEEIELSAKVVWLSDKQVQPHGYPGMGVEFVNVPGPTQQKLLEFIDRNLSFTSTDQ